MARRKRQSSADMAAARVAIQYADINDVVPYDNNPRQNDDAVESVANSIRAFGFLVPIVVDEQGIIIAGHTRWEAARRIGLTEVPVISAGDLTEEQARQFRIIDNKVSELARWDMDLLSTEITALHDSGIDFKNFGFTQEEIDCLSDVVSDDCLAATGFMDDADRQRVTAAAPRAPSQARMVLSEFVFFIPMEAYRRWANEVRATNNYDEDDIIDDLRNRLGMTPYLEAEI